jgi:hypothetical protein
MSFSQAPSNWLSNIIAAVRKSIKRLRPFREQRDERDAIVAAIKAHAMGEPLAQHAELHEVVWSALGIANHLERVAKRHPEIMTASPDIQASWFIFDELGLPRPEPEFSAGEALANK